MGVDVKHQAPLSPPDQAPHLRVQSFHGQGVNADPEHVHPARGAFYRARHRAPSTSAKRASQEFSRASPILALTLSSVSLRPRSTST